MRKTFALGVFMALTTTLLGAERMTVVLTVELKAEGRIPTLLFGQFLERPSWGGEDGPESAVEPTGDLRQAIGDAVGALKPAVIRFPGGTDVDYQDWTILIDRVSGREGGRPPFHARDGKMVVSSRFGFDEFFRLKDRLGARAILVVNLLDGLSGRRSVEDAARHAAGLVAYANAPHGAKLPEGMPDWFAVRAANGHPKPWKAEYVQLGNEAWFFPKELAPKGSDPADHYRRVLQAYIAAIRAVDPDVSLIVDSVWNRPELRDAVIKEEWFCREVKYLAVHLYRPFGSLKITPEKAGDSPALWWHRWSGAFDSLLHANRGGIGTPPTGYRWAVTEWNWNGWGYEKEAAARGVDWRQASAVACATFLHGLMRQGADEVGLATQSMLVGQQWGIAAVQYDPAAPDAAPKCSAQGQVTGLFARNAGTERLVCRLDEATERLLTPAEERRPAMPLIDALATRSGRRITLHLINRSFDRDALIQVSGVAGKPHIEAVVRGALDRSDSVHTEGSAILLPAQAVAAAVFESP